MTKEEYNAHIEMIIMYLCCETFPLNGKDVTDHDVAGHFPLLIGTPCTENMSDHILITKEMVSDIFSGIRDPYIRNCNVILNKKLNYKEHSIFLLKEHFKTILKYSNSDECKVLANKVLKKLDPDFIDEEGIKKLYRFLEAQEGKSLEGNTTYEQALNEIKNGLKFHCWIRYIFPQMRGLGQSKVTKFYEINGRYEAELYINHPVLRERLIEATRAILESDKTVYEIFGDDTMKVRACMLLFSSVSDIPEFKKLKNKYCWK